MPLAILFNLQAYCDISLLFSQFVSKTRNHDSPITDKRINPMIARAETPQLHLLSIHYLLCVAISPFHWHFRVRVCVDQDIECAVAGIELRKERYGGCDLAEDGLDFKLNILFCLLGGWFRCISVFDVRKREDTTGTEGDPCIGAAFSLSGGFDVSLEAAFLVGRLNIWTSNCHRSTCSPVSLLVITTTSFEILPPVIHLLSWDMIFLIYALT